MVRSDTAAYQHDLMRYLASGDNDRFGVIEFAVGRNVTSEFRRTVAQVPEENWKLNVTADIFPKATRRS